MRETAAAVRTALTRGPGLRPEVAKHGILADPELLSNGPSGPPLLVEGPDLLMEHQPPRLALVGQLLDRARRRWRWHWHGHHAVGLRHRRLAEGLIDGIQRVAMCVLNTWSRASARFCNR